MTLLDAPFRQPLRVLGLLRLPEEARLVLSQLGLEAGETIEKVHTAPLQDPVGLRIGEQLFTLRREVCGRIDVEVA